MITPFVPYAHYFVRGCLFGSGTLSLLPPEIRLVGADGLVHIVASCFKIEISLLSTAIDGANEFDRGLCFEIDLRRRFRSRHFWNHNKVHMCHRVREHIVGTFNCIGSRVVAQSQARQRVGSLDCVFDDWDQRELACRYLKGSNNAQSVPIA